MTDLNVTREMPSCDSELIGSFSVPIVLSVVYGAYAYGVAAWQGTHSSGRAHIEKDFLHIQMYQRNGF